MLSPIPNYQNLSPTAFTLPLFLMCCRESPCCHFYSKWLQRPMKPLFVFLTPSDVRADRISEAGLHLCWGQKPNVAKDPA